MSRKRKKKLSTPSRNSAVDKYKKYLIPGVFILFLLIGLLIYRDYGYSWDESLQRLHGIVSIDFVNQKLGEFIYPGSFSNKDLQTYDLRHHGVLFSMVGFTLERLFNLDNIREVYLLRHLMVFLLFWLATIFFFKLLRRRFKDWKLALLGTVFLILSPRIFANAFYNPKDIVLLSCYVISAFSLIRFLESKNWKWGIWHGLASAIVINTRLLGILIPVFTLMFLFFIVIHERKNVGLIRKIAALTLVYLAVTIAGSILFWPFLWENPIDNFLYTFRVLGNYPWNSDMIYWGGVIRPADLPWHYIPSWILITTPLIYLFLFITGVLFIGRNFVKSLRQKKFFRSENDLVDLVFIALFFAPILIIIVKGSAIYNGWRHVYFVYPFLLAIGITGLSEVKKCIDKQFKKSNRRKYQNGISLIIGIFLLGILINMVRMHPHQYVYFNPVAGQNIQFKFDLDYWGLSYKQALEGLLKKDKRGIIKVACDDFIDPCRKNIPFLSEDKMKRLVYVKDLNEADYYLTNYLWKDYTRLKKNRYPLTKEYLSIEVKGIKIAGVYKLK